MRGTGDVAVNKTENGAELDNKLINKSASYR